jgi:hypothetical protein
MLAMCVGGLMAGAASAAVLTLVPAGGGAITASTPPGAAVLTCSSADTSNPSCSADRAAGTVVTVTVLEAPGKVVRNWTGPCASAGYAPKCTFTMPDAPTEVGIVFYHDPDGRNGFPQCADPDYGYNCVPDCSVGVIRGDGHQYWAAGGHKICAGAFRSGMMSIGKGKIHSYTLGDGWGNLVPRHICYWRSSGAIWPSMAGTGKSLTITAWNTKNATRHWAWGVEFESTDFPTDDMGAMGFSSHGCASHEGCVSDSLNTGGCPNVDGLVLLNFITGASTLYNFGTGAYSWYTPTERAPSAPAVSASEMSARATEEGRLILVGGSTNRAGIRHLSCPSGTHMLHADTAIVGAKRGVEVDEPFVDHTLRRATFTITSIPARAHVRYQVVCRAAGAATHVATAGHIHGSSRGETHTTTQDGRHIRAGGGHDVVRATHPSAHIVGGSGNDMIIIRANRVQVMGGPGNDRIQSWAPGASHIEGNAGNDTLVSHRGRTTINSQDGSPGDTVICDRGSKAIVFIDEGDTVRGSCTVAHRR